MLSLSKLLTKRPISLATECLNVTSINSARTYFTTYHFSIDQFIKYSSRTAKENEGNLVNIKTNIQQALQKPDTKIFTDDLKVLLYSTKDETDLDLLLNGLKRYQSQESSGIFNYNFDAPLMRLLYTMNKTDLALTLFAKNNEMKFEGSSARLILMNKLFEEKRYQDVIKVGQIMLEKDIEKLPTFDFSKLYLNALLEINTPEAVKLGEELVSLVKKNKKLVNNRGLLSLFLLCIQQNNLEMAYELTSLENKNDYLYQNMKILALSKLNRLDEALEHLNIFLQQRREFGKGNLYVFKDTFDALFEAAKKNSDKEKPVIEQLLQQFAAFKRVSNYSMKEIAQRAAGLTLEAVQLKNERERDREGLNSGYDSQSNENGLRFSNEYRTQRLNLSGNRRFDDNRRRENFEQREQRPRREPSRE